MSIDFDYGFRTPERVPAKPQPGKFKADELVAWCGLLAALRRDPDIFAGRSTCIAITLPSDHPFEPYEFAANALGSWLDRRRRKRPSEASLPVIRFVGGRALAEGSTRPRKPGEVANTVRACRVVLGLAHGEDEFSAEFLTLADRIVTIGPATARRIKFAAKRVAELDLPDDLADDLLRLPLESLSLAIRKGRSLRQVREAAARLVKAPSAPDKPLTLDDLKGFGPADEWGRQLAVDLADWRSGRLRWADVDRGLLLSGPPGCGKTTYARALAGTCGVPLVAGSIARWQAAGHLGDLLKAMRACFDEASSKVPCILFLDEVDAFGDRATFDPHHRDYSTQVVAGLLECLDGVEGREGIVVVGAANYPERLDAALRRPGRLDRHIEIPLPNAEAREGIIRFHASGESPDGDLGEVVSKTDGWSGAQLEQMVRTARRAARVARRKMTVDDLVAALPELLQIPQHLVWRNAVHEAGHVVAILELGTAEIEYVAIRRDLDPESHVQSAGVTSTKRPRVLHRDRAWYIDEITVLLAGAAAEEVLLGGRSDGWGGGPGSDLQRATELAVTLEASVGLGTGLAYLGPGMDAEPVLLRDAEMRARADALLSGCMTRAKSIIERRRKALGRLARALLSRGRIEGTDVRRACGCDRPKDSSTQAGLP